MESLTIAASQYLQLGFDTRGQITIQKINKINKNKMHRSDSRSARKRVHKNTGGFSAFLIHHDFLVCP
jgi:hypothetical protein